MRQELNRPQILRSRPSHRNQAQGCGCGCGCVCVSGQTSRAAAQGLKKRAAELEKKPRSVIKGAFPACKKQIDLQSGQKPFRSELKRYTSTSSKTQNQLRSQNVERHHPFLPAFTQHPISGTLRSDLLVLMPFAFFSYGQHVLGGSELPGRSADRRRRAEKLRLKWRSKARNASRSRWHGPVASSLRMQVAAGSQSNQ